VEVTQLFDEPPVVVPAAVRHHHVIEGAPLRAAARQSNRYHVALSPRLLPQNRTRYCKRKCSRRASCRPLQPTPAWQSTPGATAPPRTRPTTISPAPFADGTAAPASEQPA